MHQMNTHSLTKVQRSHFSCIFWSCQALSSFCHYPCVLNLVLSGTMSISGALKQSPDTTAIVCTSTFVPFTLSTSQVSSLKEQA